MTTRRGFLGFLAGLPVAVKAAPALPSTPPPATDPAALTDAPCTLTLRPVVYVRHRIIQLYGQQQFPVAVARGAREFSVDGKTWANDIADLGLTGDDFDFRIVTSDDELADIIAQ